MMSLRVMNSPPIDYVRPAGLPMTTNIHELMSRKERKRLTRRSDFRGLLQLFAHILLLLMSGYMISLAQNSAWVFPALLLYGIALTFIFAPLHESIHYTAFSSRWLNSVVAAISGFILVIPYRYFRAYHYAHHRYTQKPDRDPELIGKKSFTRSSLLWHLTGLPFWKSNISILWNHARGVVNEPYLGSRTHGGIVLEARIHLVLYLLIVLISLFYASSWVLLYWIIPALLGQPFLRLFLMAEHSNCDPSDNMLENSRTTYASPVVNFLAWNMPYHAEHHYLASVPFHALPALHAYTGQSVKYRGDGYWRVLRKVIGKVIRNR